MKRILKPAAAALLLVLACAALAACGPARGAGMKPVVRLATGVDPSFTPVYVAAKKGFFKKHGVDVDYYTTEGGPTMTQAVIAGEAQMATQSDGTTLTLMASNPDLRGLAVMEQSSTYIKVAWGKNVSKPQDIKKMGVIPGVATLATVRYLESKGVDPDSVEFVEATPPDVPTLLERGDIDASVIYEPWASRAAEQAGGKIVGNIGDFGMNYTQWLVTDNKWLSKNKKAAAGVVAAIAEADEYTNEHPEEAAQITQDAIKTPKDQTLAIMKDIQFGVRDYTAADLTSYASTAKFFVDRGLIKSEPDVQEQVLKGWWTENGKS
jgi:NitT/TauT family transport system substrate-binding protein